MDVISITAVYRCSKKKKKQIKQKKKDSEKSLEGYSLIIKSCNSKKIKCKKVGNNSTEFGTSEIWC